MSERLHRWRERAGQQHLLCAWCPRVAATWLVVLFRAAVLLRAMTSSERRRPVSCSGVWVGSGGQAGAAAGKGIVPCEGTAVGGRWRSGGRGRVGVGTECWLKRGRVGHRRDGIGFTLSTRTDLRLS
jgi:hypothetical protein